MDAQVFIAMLVAAAFHAGWNAMIKLKLDPLLTVSLISIACGVVALPFVPLTGLPSPAAWPYVLTSLAVHILYYLALAEAYRQGDLGHVYPIARGSAPLMTALGAYLLVGENPGPLGWLGIAVLASGILLLSVRGGPAGTRFDHRSIGFAMLTAVTITAYTLADGIGARLAGSAASYIVWLFLLDGIMMLAFGCWRFGPALLTEARGSWGLIAIAGAMSTAAYGIAIWAMTRAPIALVAALRETSVLFAALIAIVVLREPVVPSRIVAAGLVVLGAALLRLKSLG
jgi:drug/metabolite transporter (DMT)-like permease